MLNLKNPSLWTIVVSSAKTSVQRPVQEIQNVSVPTNFIETFSEKMTGNINNYEQVKQATVSLNLQGDVEIKKSPESEELAFIEKKAKAKQIELFDPMTPLHPINISNTIQVENNKDSELITKDMNSGRDTVQICIINFL